MKSVLLASFLFLLAEFSFAEELTNYTITSDSQINTLEGDLEAKGNVVIRVIVVILRLIRTSFLLTRMINL